MSPDPRELFEHLAEKLRERGDDDGVRQMEACLERLKPRMQEAAG